MMGGEESSGEKFPVGMRVLAVDDDPICLKVLETLLLRCQYHVTTTNQAIKALNLLRENKDKFDLVISDVHMPDMDGFKLLELVGLEMDLPVIMLSANGETKAVMKGISHGACDYLLKPVRIEELRNIWQHVVRRRKFDRKDHNEEDNEMAQASNCEGTQGANASGPIDSNGKVRKRKDQYNDDEDDDCEEDNHESEDPSNQKKPRVVWSVELHRKFVAAVNQLGIDKAVPKRILDIMNVDKLTRENVASHLQKYRLYLKRLSAVTSSQQASLAAVLGGRETSYLHMGPYDDFGNFYGLTPFQPNGVSTKANPSLPGITGFSPGLVQNGTTNPLNDYSKYQNIAVPVNHHEHLFRGISTSLELDHQQQKQKSISESHNDLQGAFSGASKNAFIDSASKSLLLHGGFCNQALVPVSTTSANCPQMNNLPSTHLPGLTKCSDTWKNFASLNAFNTNSFSIGTTYEDCNINSNNMEASLTSSISPMHGNSLNISSNTLLVGAQTSIIRPDMQCQNSSLGDNTFIMSSKRAGYIDQKLNDHKQQNAHEQNLAFNYSLNSIDGQRLKNQFFNKKVDANMIFSKPVVDTTFIPHYDKSSKSSLESRFAFCEDNMLGESNNFNIDDLMNAMIKSERDDIGFTDSEIASDLFSLGTCLGE